uniref:Cytochrome b5 heme-binding domain-containing protein n=1 Tax=Amphora coffeiformis TaxID=265554 RepID=A0A7S3L716_9STRA
MEAADDLSEWVCHYGSLYGPQIVLLATLSAITIYRREMSCNHCYAASSRNPRSNMSARKSNSAITSSRTHQWNELKAEHLLDGVGLYYSGASLLPVVMHLLEVYKETELCATTDATEEMLEHAGNFFSGEPFANLLASPRKMPLVARTSLVRDGNKDYELFAGHLPSDLQIHVCSFLHPRDVTNFASVNRACRATVEVDPWSSALWKLLFERDFVWSLKAWDVGRQAKARSDASSILYSKDFYFRFQLAFCDYVLAGQNTAERCLVGLGGDIFDLTPFVLAHPGSPETLLVSAGKDATQFFANVRHSSGALRLAKSLCVVVDASTNRGGVGLKPTRHTDLIQHEEASDLPSRVEAELLDLNELRAGPSAETLRLIRGMFAEERLAAEGRARRSRHGQHPRLTDINVYYDPLERSWKAWYTNPQMEPVFIGQV